MKYLVLLLLSLICYALTQTNNEYIADFVQTGGQLSGKLTGTLYYSQSMSGLKLSYTTGYYEILKFDTNAGSSIYRYKKCTNKCDVAPQDPSAVFPVYYYVQGDTCATTAITTVTGKSCFPCTKASDFYVDNICVQDTTSFATVRITLKDGTNFDVSNFRGGIAASDLDPTPWGCQLNCIGKIDIGYLVDESGSITGDYVPATGENDGDWKLIRDFSILFVNSIDIAPDKVNIGLVMFGRGSRTVLPIISDSATYNQVIFGLTKCKTPSGDKTCQAGTWTGAGFVDTVNILIDQSGARALRAKIPKVIVIVTDGNDNQQSNPFAWDGRNWLNKPYPGNDWLTYTAQNNIRVIAVGVGPLVDINFLNIIASKDPVTGKPLSFLTTDWQGLTADSLIKELGKTVCTAAAQPAADCPLCRGQCTCGVCNCPDSCDLGDVCKVGVCNATKNNGGGCFYTDLNCDDSNACTNDSCDSKLGCQHVNISCDDGDPCTTDSCTPAIGCLHVPLDCTQKDLCYTSQCDPAKGACSPPVFICNTSNACTKAQCSSPTNCTYTAVDCTGGNKCKTQKCDLTTGCKSTDVSCDTKNKCSNDSCDPTDGSCLHVPVNCLSGDACSKTTCDPKLGCVYTKFNISVDCDDGDACTTDSCNTQTGCTHTLIVCNNSINGTNTTNGCIQGVCDHATGCSLKPVVCPPTNDSCLITFCDSKQGKCIVQKLDKCNIAAIVGGTAAAVLGAGIIAAIVIAAVVCAGGSGVAAYVGYNRLVHGDFDNKNPLYESDTKTAQNPAYNRESVFNQPPVKPN